MNSTLRKILRCPDCKGELKGRDAELRCEPCGHDFPVEDEIPSMMGSTADVNASEVATQDHVSDYYELVRYQRPHARALHTASVQRMCELVRVGPMVLDNGCGNGFILETCAPSYPDSQFFGIDISKGMLGKAKRHGASLVHGDSCRLPFADGTFDTILARALLHHLPAPEKGVAEMIRVLKPGGELVVLDTNKTIISSLPRALANRGEHFDEAHKNFRASELCDILREHASVDRVEFMGYVAYPLMGFPDLFDFSKVLPMSLVGDPLLWMDRKLSELPLIRRLGWGVVVKAHRAA
jgi:ubiquinone/menaquinone biosynthesis C-methylase UbiE